MAPLTHPRKHKGAYLAGRYIGARWLAPSAFLARSHLGGRFLRLGDGRRRCGRRVRRDRLRRTRRRSNGCRSRQGRDLRFRHGRRCHGRTWHRWGGANAPRSPLRRRNGRGLRSRRRRCGRRDLCGNGRRDYRRLLCGPDAEPRGRRRWLEGPYSVRSRRWGRWRDDCRVRRSLRRLGGRCGSGCRRAGWPGCRSRTRPGFERRSCRPRGRGGRCRPRGRRHIGCGGLGRRLLNRCGFLDHGRLCDRRLRRRYRPRGMSARYGDGRRRRCRRNGLFRPFPFQVSWAAEFELIVEFQEAPGAVEALGWHIRPGPLGAVGHFLSEAGGGDSVDLTRDGGTRRLIELGRPRCAAPHEG